MDHVRLICIAIDCVGLLGGVLLMQGRGAARAWVGELLALCVHGVLLALLAAVTMMLVARDNFAVIRVLCHVLFCVLCPLAGWRGVVWAMRPRGWLRVGGGLVALLAVVGEGVYVYARRVEPFRLQVSRERVHSQRLTGLREPIRIVAVADVQTEAIGAYEQRVGRSIDAEQADLLLFLGDYVQRRAGERERYEAEIGRFRAWVSGLQHVPRLGVFAVDGDCEWITDVLHGSARTLVDTAIELPTEVPIQLLGLGLPTSRRPLRADLAQQVERYGGFSIVFGHAPDFMLAALRGVSRFDALLLAGHCHGGQIVVPGFGPIATLSAVPRALARGELWHRGDAWLRVSRGIGVERGHAPPIRLFCPPEIVVIELAPK